LHQLCQRCLKKTKAFIGKGCKQFEISNQMHQDVKGFEHKNVENDLYRFTGKGYKRLLKNLPFVKIF